MIDWLRGRRARPDDLLLGAAIGLGMTARAAAQGGADFLLALNAGRLRVMGAASIAGMLPIRDANAFTEDFASREILGRVSVPILFGAAACDPRLDPAPFAARLRRAGYAGIANFPTAIHLDGRFRAAVEAAGLGFGREVELLRTAKAAGLASLGYAKTREEVARLVEAGVDMICLNFGWNAGGDLGIAGGLALDEAADRARRLFQFVRNAAPHTLCLVEGGPIVSPDDMWRVCSEARADGYVGGSTLDRLPLEMSVMRTTSAFKATTLLRAARESASREQIRLGALAGLRGQSIVAQALAERIASVASTDLPVLVCGEPGVGKTTVARGVHVASRRGGPHAVLDGRQPAPELERALFGLAGGRGGALGVPDSTVTIEFVDAAGGATQARLVEWIDRAVLERFDVTPERPSRARLVATLLVGREGALREELRTRLEPARLVVPPLRDRPEDVPLIARAILATLGREGGPPEIDPSGHRALMAHAWPGNVRELRTALNKAATLARDRAIDAELLAPILAETVPDAPAAPADEREWILDALRRNRFRRAETAAFLRLSRKTLYNKMRRHNLLG
ncbi:MAG TPA: phosphoenolpyruvate hydrolase family protein [Salinarimonas sp.]|nr:phosphoenolpyruvate hydrolase family protein [Salinarimonas sp.]